jgi:hypothetical protein
MRNNLKFAAVAVILLLAFGAVVFIYAARQNSVALADTQSVNTAELRTFISLDNQTYLNNQTGSIGLPPCQVGGRGMMGGREFGQFLSENTTLATIEGTVVAKTRDILVLSTTSGQVDVTIPRDWTVGNEVVNGRSLFNGTFASSGQTVTLSVLESQMFSNASFSINSMLAYKVTNATDTIAYAVLPFNIQPAS